LSFGVGLDCFLTNGHKLLLVSGFVQQGSTGKAVGFRLTNFVAVTDCDDIFLLRPAFWVLAGLDLSDFFWIDMRASSVGLPCR
jgi:hypothetical protein